MTDYPAMTFDPDCETCRAAKATGDPAAAAEAWASHQVCEHPDCVPHGPRHERRAEADQ